MMAKWARRNKVKSLWIVTEVLYATKFLVEGRSGLFGRVSAQVPSGIPGLNAGGDITVQYERDNVVKLEAKRRRQFIIGYRTMRVDFNPDGSVQAVRAPADTGLRGDNDDDPCKRNLKLMEEDIFEVDEEGDNVPIPLLTPTKEELDYLKQTDANYRDLQGSVSS